MDCNTLQYIIKALKLKICIEYIFELFISKNPEMVIFKTEVNVNFQVFCGLETNF